MKETKLRAEKLARNLHVVKISLLSNKRHILGVYSAKFDKMYLTLPSTFCSCTDFLFNVYLRKNEKYCIHLSALDIALEKHYIRELKLLEKEFRKHYVKLLLKGMLL